MTPRTFALLGAAGFVAPRHLKAIKATGNDLVAAMDPSDSVGIIDSFFPNADFFTEFERFDRHVDKLRRRKEPIDYVSICSPNYLHDAHIRFALRSQATAIAEKPVVVNPWNLEPLVELERENGVRIHTILQLRLHPVMIKLRETYRDLVENGIDVDLTYITSRGKWYYFSWKGDDAKSGGIVTNIGIHFFDILAWIFGPSKGSIVHLNRPDCAAGVLELARARVRWFLSINGDHLPADVQSLGQRTYRSIRVEGREIEFSEGFTDLHTRSYEEILAGNGYGLSDSRPAIEIAHDIRTAATAPLQGDFHPFCRLV
ncbi:MAG: putative dehydrogenase [Gemmatimonadetes bacterium]|nr:putative dehydrogenase [Gemmatimonadota bacterium]